MTAARALRLARAAARDARAAALVLEESFRTLLEDCLRDLANLLEITEVLRMPLKDVLNPFLRLLEATLKEPLRALPDLLLLETIVALRKPRKEVLKPTLGLLETIVVPR